MRSFLRGSLYGVTASTGWAPGSPTGAGANSSYPNGSAQHQQAPTTVQPSSVRSSASAAVSHAASMGGAASSTTSVAAFPNAYAIPLHFAARQSYGGFPIYGSSVSEAETATRRAEKSVRGRVSKWFDTRGFGFIEDAESQEQFFVHARDLIMVEGGQRCLFPGQTVEFEPEHTDNGGHALRVSGPGGAPLQSGAGSSAVAAAAATEAAAARVASSQSVDSLANSQHDMVASGSSVAQHTTTSTSTVSASLPSYDSAVEEGIEGKSSLAAEEQQPAPVALALPQPRLVGSIAHWTYDKGYGFVAVPGQDEHFFTHIKDFTCEKPHMSPSMPATGLEVEFTPSTAGNKRRATHVTLPGSTPFQPNVVATPAPAYNSGIQQQQQQQQYFYGMQQMQQFSGAFGGSATPMKPHAKPSALAMAFAPEQFAQTSSSSKKDSATGTNAGAVPFFSQRHQQQPPQPQQQVEAALEQLPPHESPMWRAGYSSGFVDGQHYLQQEIGGMQVNPPQSVPFARASSTASSSAAAAEAAAPVQQQSANAGRRAPSAERSGFSRPQRTSVNAASAAAPSSPQHPTQSRQQLSPVRRSSFTQQQQERSASTSSARSTGGFAAPSGTQQKQFADPWKDAVTATGAASTTTTTTTVIPAVDAAPKWASSWGGASTTETATESKSSASEVSTTTAASATPVAPVKGFPAFPQRGGFGGFGRGSGAGGRGNRGRGW